MRNLRTFYCGSFLLLILLQSFYSKAQVLTAEDSLYAGLVAKEQSTVLSGYGEARYAYDTKKKNASASLSRAVLFVGHKFNNRISLFTELELEDALVVGQSGDEDETGKGGVSMEQAFIKFNVNPSNYIVAGLFIPRIGFINENHLPTTFNGVDRPFLEELVIPSTWREVGVGFYGTVKAVPGLNYTVAVTNGLNSSLFKNGSGIRNGRQLGSQASGLGLGTNASVLYYVDHFRLQASVYAGGTTAVERRVADSLQLNSGLFGNPVIIGEVNAQYSNKGWNFRVIGATVNIPEASNINKAYANNTPNQVIGCYAEAAYDLLYHRYQGSRAFSIFARYETMDLSAKIPNNGIENDANKQQYFVGGLTYKPIRGISVKLDYVQKITGEPNPVLIITPFPTTIPYFKSNGFVNLGVAYNF